VHADVSNFGEGVTKEAAYEQVLLSAEGLFDGQRNWVGAPSLVSGTTITAFQLTQPFDPRSGKGEPTDEPPHHTPLTAASNLANTASLLWHAYHSLPAPSSAVNWAGFYVLDPSRPADQLILGPFHGKVACQTIRFGRGVCGTAASTGTTLLVRDVNAFPGHIACDGDSKSEIVVPVVAADRKVVAVIDVDCAQEGGFDEVDKQYLERLASLVGRSCDW
jgi:L-methionine (R)-S-oxide reductase